jgi:hypothetical protein
MLIHLNYTFSFLDKWLYTLFKGIKVTSSFVRVSSVSSHGRAPLHATTFCLLFVRRPLHVRHAYMWCTLLTNGGHQACRTFGDEAFERPRQPREGPRTSNPVPSPDARALLTNGATGQAVPSALKVRDAILAAGKFQNPRAGFAIRYL